MARQQRLLPVLVIMLAAIALEVLPLPGWAEVLRPPLPAMVLIYWAMMWPERVGVGFAFIIGICLDILHGELLGQNALSLAVVTYLTLRFHLRIRIFPLWQLTMAVLALLFAGAVVDLLVEGIGGLAPAGYTRWTRVLSGAIFWPLVLAMLDRLRLQVEHRGSSY